MADTIELGPFPLGINNTAKETNIPDGALREALNVDLDNAGLPSTRKGIEKIYSGNKPHSIYKRYFVEDFSFKYLEADNTATNILSLNSNSSISYCSVNGEIIASNGEDLFRINGDLLWPEKPAQVATLSEISGNLNAGTYSVDYRYIDTYGRVSPSAGVQRITISDNGGIAISNLSTEYNVEVFMTNTDEETLYSRSIVSTSNTSILSLIREGRVLDTQYLEILPPGTKLTFYKGRLYSVSGSTIWFSKPMHYLLCDKSQDVLPYNKSITMCEGVESGLFISTEDGVRFLRGTNPDEFTQSGFNADAAAISGTSILVPGNELGYDFTLNVACWYSKKGPVVGLPDGQIKILKEGEFISDSYKEGISYLRKEDGFSQILSSLNNKDADGFSARVYATARVVRNGIVIQED